MKLFFSRPYYVVEVRVTGVNGTGQTWRGVANGTMRDCRMYADKVLTPNGIMFRVLKEKVVFEQGGTTTSDHLRALFRSQLLRELAQEFDERADD